MRAEDLDYQRRDLWEASARKDYPTWRLEMQIMPYEDAANYRFNPFDITKVWPHKDDDDFIQPGTLYRQVMSPTDRDHLVENIVWHLSQGVERFIQERAITEYWGKVDSDLGTRVARGLGITAPQPTGGR